MNPAVAGGARQEALVSAQRNSPDVASRGLGRGDLKIECPLAVGKLPYLDLAAKAYAGRDIPCAASRGGYVVAAELVGIFDRLLVGEGGFCCAVDADGG